MNIETQHSPEFEDTRHQLADFVASRENAAEVQSYEELQDIIRGQRDLPGLLSEYIHTIGEQKTDDTDRVFVAAHLRADHHKVHAYVEYRNDKPNCVTISARPRIPLVSKFFGNRQLVSLHLNDPTWDQAVTRFPILEAYMPFTSSPESINFWASAGERPVYTGDGGLPTTTTGKIAREASAEALDTFNNFLNITTTLVDRLLQSK